MYEITLLPYGRLSGEFYLLAQGQKLEDLARNELLHHLRILQCGGIYLLAHNLLQPTFEQPAASNQIGLRWQFGF